MLYSEKEYEILRQSKLFRDSNKGWNQSGVNHPKNIGYLMPKISELRPKAYEEWETYFLKHIADESKIKEYTKEFSKQLDRQYEREDLFMYVCCRLIYETFLGYVAECKASKKFLHMVRRAGFDIKQYGVSGESDNRYAIDRVVYFNGKLRFAIQIKSTRYMRSSRDILKKTKASNHKKNKKFSEEKGVPVLYVVYDREKDYQIVNFEELLPEIRRCLEAA